MEASGNASGAPLARGSQGMASLRSSSAASSSVESTASLFPSSSESTASLVAVPPGDQDNSSISTATVSSNSSGSGSSSNAGANANARYYNPVVMSFIRDDWIQQQMHRRQADYTVYQQTRVVAGTWNVNAKKPPTPAEAARIVQWLDARTCGAASPAPLPLPDVVALGFQEIVDLNAVNVVVNSNMSAQRSAAWLDAVLAALNEHLAAAHAAVTREPRRQYKLVLEKHLVGILLLVLVRDDHLEHVREVFGATAGVGIMGMMGNKGGAAVRLRFYDSTLCFVCSHLAAHRENVAGRNADYHNILSKIQFLGDNDDECPNDMRHLTGEAPILNHDFVFWVGDLNYRINDELSAEEVFQCAERGDLAELRPHDQLSVERKRGAVLQGFEEGALGFRPTYKFQAGTSVYEKRPEKKLRAPAWCDRILWKARAPEDVALHTYDCVMGLDLSDHKPVHAGFELQVRHQVDAKKKQVMREIMMQLDRWENDNLPKVQLRQSDGVSPSSGVLSFSHLKFGTDQSQSILVENTGIVVAHFRFIPKLDELVVCKPWLRVAPMFGMIPPKERVEIRIVAHVDDVVAHGLTSGSETLDDTMILRIENGRDYFLVVSGQYDNSCFGNSLEQLVACNDPVRHVKFPPPSAATAASMFSVWACGNPSAFSAPKQLQAADSAMGAPATATECNSTAQKVPKELWRMVNDIYQHSMQEKNLFVEAGNEAELALLREALDTGRTFPEHSGYSTAELLLVWLQSLRQSVVPDEILTAAIANGNGELTASCSALLEMLPPVRYNVVIYLVSFLREVLKHSHANKLSAEKLAFVFSRSLVSPCRIGRMDSAVSVIQTAPMPGPGATAGAKQQGAQSSQAPGSSSSTASTTSISSAPTSLPASLLLPEERVRRNAREAEVAQWNAVQRAERMEAVLLHMLATPAL